MSCVCLKCFYFKRIVVAGATWAHNRVEFYVSDFCIDENKPKVDIDDFGKLQLPLHERKFD